jgi:spore germination protein GerM
VTRRILASVLALALLGGCGLSEDDGPQAIPLENLPPDLLDPTPGASTSLPAAGTTPVSVYFLERSGDRDRLVEVERGVRDPNERGVRINALLDEPTAAEAEEGIATSIPANTTLLDVQVGDDPTELVVNLSNEIFDVEGEALAKAFAQIVWTATGPDAGGYRSVRFLVDGEARNALDADGVEKDGAVTRQDYSALAPG